MPPPYGLLLISGNHTHQENYARAFAADERCRLIGLADESDVSDRRCALNQELADELSIPHLDDLDAALARDDVQIVCVCAEPERRGRLAAQIARAGKHIYVDKPLAASSDDAAEIAQAVHESGVFSQMFSLVRIPIARRAERLIASGRLGRLIGLHAEVTFAKGIAGAADLSRPRQELSEAGRLTFVDSKRELYCVGLYPLVLFQWLTRGSFRDVYATTANYFFAEHQKNNVEDFSSLILTMDDDVQATITVGRTGWSTHPDFGIHQLHLVGSEQSVFLDAFRPRLEIYSDAPPWKQTETPHPEDPMGFWSSTTEEGGVEPKESWLTIEKPLQSDAAHFLDCIEAGTDSDVNAAVGAHVVDVIMASYRSAAAREVVEIPPRHNSDG